LPVALALLAATAAPSAAAQAAPGAVQTTTLPDIAAHLREARTMTADFTQTAADGGVARGKLVLARPGKVRFQFEPSVPMLIVADGNMLSMIDYEVDQVSRWPIKSTPLSVFLDPDRELSRYARILPTEGGSDVVAVQAQDTKHPEYGTLTMYFRRDRSAPAGLRLTAWRVLDAQGNVTRVELSNIRFNVPVPDNSFTFRDPRPRRAPGRL
jgi:outer membrane lipoprotein-sorting protein